MRRFILSVTIMITALSAMAFTAAAQGPCDEQAAQAIYPYPQEACLHDPAPFPEKMSFDFAPGVTVPGDILERYTEWLKANSVEVSEGARNVVSFKASTLKHETTLRQEGYEIVVDEKPFRIKISAATDVGFLYALFTLRDMVEEGGLRTGTLTDFPRFSYRGIIEGGYSVWGHQQRLDVIKWMGKLKMNTFMYAPKEGYFFRRRWREPFSEEALDEFREYVEACRRDRVKFIMALSPVLSIEHSNPKEFELLVAKYRQIQDLGVSEFAIFFDDVLPVLAYPSDRKIYSHIAEAEADISNRLLEALRERDPSVRLAFCPRQYWGWTPTKYIEIHRNNLHPDIPIGWTGIDIVSQEIPTEHAVKFAEAWGRQPAIGDNFSPFGPLVNRSPDLYKTSDTFINNPYGFADDNEAQLSKFVNATVGDYGWNPEGYEPTRSFTLASARLAGDEDDARALLFMLAVKRKQVHSPDMKEVARAVRLFGKRGGTASAILSTLEATGYANGIPRAKGMNPLLVEQIESMYAEAEAHIAKAVQALNVLIENPDDGKAFGTVQESLGLNGK